MVCPKKFDLMYLARSGILLMRKLEALPETHRNRERIIECLKFNAMIWLMAVYADLPGEYAKSDDEICADLGWGTEAQDER